MRICFLLGWMLCALHSFADTPEQPLLVTPQWVNDHLNDPDLVILQANYLKLDYDKEHIAGARFLWPEWLIKNTPDGNFNVPGKTQVQNTLRKLGINQKSKVVICHVRGEVTVTSRIVLTLEQVGLRGKVSYLNGGLEAWKKAGFPVTQAVPVVKPGNFVPRFSNIIVDKNYVLKALKSDSAVVVDARMKTYYDGEPTGNPRDGHITGAMNIPFPEMIDSLNQFKPLDQMEPYFNAAAPDKKDEIVLYCFIGQTASVVYMAGRLLGYRMRLYDASLQEWSRRDELPMEKTPK